MLKNASFLAHILLTEKVICTCQYFLWVKLEFLSFGFFPVDVTKLAMKPDSEVLTRTYLLTVVRYLTKD